MALNHTAEQVWKKYFGDAESGRDECGATIHRDDHGQRGRHGWEIDHIVPLNPKMGPKGANALYNKRPLHWKNNDAKADNIDGYWTCAVGTKKGQRLPRR